MLRYAMLGGKGGKSDTLGGAFYHVAVDCPGYGRSSGSAKTVIA